MPLAQNIFTENSYLYCSIVFYHNDINKTHAGKFESYVLHNFQTVMLDKIFGQIIYF